MGEKGNIKNLYKSWRLFLKKKKKEKNKEEEYKKKKFMKVKAFVLTFFTVIISPFAINFQSSKKSKKSVSEIYIELKEINKTLEKEESVEKLKEVKEKLETYKDVTKVKVKDDEKKKLGEVKAELASLTARVDKVIAVKELVKKNEDKKEVKEIIVKDNRDNIVEPKKIEEVVIASSSLNPRGSKSIEVKLKSDEMVFNNNNVHRNDENQIQNNNAFDNNININNNNNNNNNINSFDQSFKEDVYIAPKSYIIKHKKKGGIAPNQNIISFLTFANLEVEDISAKLTEDLSLDNLKIVKKRIDDLHLRRMSIKAKYTFNSDIYSKQDKFKLLKSNEKIEELYNKCQLKMDNFNVKETEEIKEEKKNPVPVFINPRELNALKKIISEDVAKRNLEVMQIKERLGSMEIKVRKASFLSTMTGMIKKSLSICFGFIPMFLFKNKFVGGLASAFLLNNSIRSIRNVVNERQTVYLQLNELGHQVNNQKDCIQKTRYIYEDAITQAYSLRTDLLSRYRAEEIEDILMQIDEMEKEIRNKNSVLMTLEDELNMEYEKSKQKIKKYAA